MLKQIAKLNTHDCALIVYIRKRFNQFLLQIQNITFFSICVDLCFLAFTWAPSVLNVGYLGGLGIKMAKWHWFHIVLVLLVKWVAEVDQIYGLHIGYKCAKKSWEKKRNSHRSQIEVHMGTNTNVDSMNPAGKPTWDMFAAPF